MTKGTIYILDDDSEVRDSLSSLLESCGYKAYAVETADAFLARCNDAAPDCALVDIRMPGISGLELLSIMRARQMSVPVVIITGHGDVQTAVQSMKLGAVDVLQKPFSQETLIAAVRAAMQRAIVGGETLSPISTTSPAPTLAVDVQQRLKTLSPREREILDFIVQGKSSREIAEDLSLSVATVNNHRTQIKTKMEAKTVAHLLAMLNPSANVA